MKTSRSLLFTITLLALFFAGTGFASAQTKKDTVLKKHTGYAFDNGKETLDKKYVDRILARKVKAMEKYLTVLIEKKKTNYQSYIDSAMMLFNDDESKTITINSKNTGKVSVKPVRDYLNDVARLPYKSINITYRNYTAIRNIRKQPDGSYRGVAILEQEFTGFDKEGRALYNDIVRRDIEVIIKIREYLKKSYHQVTMDIFFGNIGVTEIPAA